MVAAAARFARIFILDSPVSVCYLPGFQAKNSQSDLRKERKLWQASKPEVLYAVPTR